AGYVAAKKYGAEIVDPRPYATPFFRKIYEEYPHLGPVLPSMGYRSDQLMELQEVINSTPADVVVLGTPSNLARLIKINKPVVRVKFRIKIIEGPSIEEIVNEFLEKTRFKIG
ncbi:MAG: GTPase, partial [Desulfurococcaceae archaeon]